MVESKQPEPIIFTMARQFPHLKQIRTVFVHTGEAWSVYMAGLGDRLEIQK